jgi:RNA polymerase sigma-70 factor (ECF subfamily)
VSFQEEESLFIERIAKGDQEAFLLLNKKMGGRVFGFCCRLLNDRQRAEDLTQETWMKVIEKSSTYSPHGSAVSWIFTIARNLCLNELRDFNKEILQDSDLTERELNENNDSVEETLSRHQDHVRLKKAIDQLPEKQRIVLTIHLVEELSDSEIAKQLNLSVGAVKALLFRARETLRSSLDPGGKP